MRNVTLPLVMAVALAGCVTARPEVARPASWAQPVVQAQLPNLQRVDDGLWRSALPRHPDAATLRALGVHTVINLRPQSDPPWFAGAGIITRQVGIDTWNIDETQIAQVLRIAIDPAQRPVLIHCTHGADRTGVMIAAYRVVVQGWSKPEAEREMIRGGYGYHLVWINLPRVLRRLDVAKMRRELGLPPAA
ncbi:MAG: tyrosine-protein phosphatase [Thermomonas sp.]